MTTEELARWLERNCPGGGTLWPEAAKAAARLRELEHESRRLREENEAWNAAAITLQSENKRLRRIETALRDARNAIASLDPDELGIGGRLDSTHWYIRDELITKIDTALEAPND